MDIHGGAKNVTKNAKSAKRGLNANKDSCPSPSPASSDAEKDGDCGCAPAEKKKLPCNDLKLGELYVHARKPKKPLSEIMHEMREDIRVQDTTCKRKKT